MGENLRMRKGTAENTKETRRKTRPIIGLPEPKNPSCALHMARWVCVVVRCGGSKVWRLIPNMHPSKTTSLETLVIRTRSVKWNNVTQSCAIVACCFHLHLHDKKRIIITHTRQKTNVCKHYILSSGKARRT